MFDHVAVNVSDMDASRRFFEHALAPLGYEVSFDSPHWVGMGAAGRHDFGIVRRDPVSPAVHLAFEAPDRATVDAFHEAALAAGGTDNGAPVYARTTASTTTRPSSSAPTATTSRPSRRSLSPPPERVHGGLQPHPVRRQPVLDSRRPRRDDLSLQQPGLLELG